MIRYGFACKTVGVPGTDQTTLTLAKADDENLLRVSRHNLNALGTMLRYCHAEHIPFMRISSGVIPLASHPRISFDWRNTLQTELADIQDVMRTSGVRVSMHPGQYTVLNSSRNEVIERAVEDLRFHADFLDAVGSDHTARIVLHVGGEYGDKQAAIARFKNAVETLPDSIRTRLSLENDERSYTIEDVLMLCEHFSMPAIFDVFHHSLNPPPQGSMVSWLDASALTWNAANGRQKIHYSQQLPGGRVGMHSLTIRTEEFFAFHTELGKRELDVMLEVKDKNLSALKCAYITDHNVPRKRLTDEWARYKYLVLEHDPSSYAAIRSLLKVEQPDARAFYEYIEQALEKNVTPGHARNAAEHVWGYVDTIASPAESRRIITDMCLLDSDSNARPRLKRRLFALAEKSGQSYLLQSLYFYI